VILGLSVVRVLALGPPSTDPACTNPPLDNCAFYANCLESRYQCGPSGYPLGYGQYYCQKSLDNRDAFDAKGKQWVTNTMHCLQLALVADAVNSTPPASDCEALESEAFATHPGCFTSNGICTLGVHDWAVLLEILGITTLISNWDVFKASIETAADCGAFYAYMVERGLF